MHVQQETARGIPEAFANADFNLGRDSLGCGLLPLHLHGLTVQGRRFNPYTIERRTKEMTSNTTAVSFAPT